MSDYTSDQRSTQLAVETDKIEDVLRQALFPVDDKGVTTATLAELVKAIYTVNATLQKIEKKIGATNIQPQPGRLEKPVKTTKTTKKSPKKTVAKKKK